MSRPFYISAAGIEWRLERKDRVALYNPFGVKLRSISAKTCFRSLEMSTAGPNAKQIKAALTVAMKAA